MLAETLLNATVAGESLKFGGDKEDQRISDFLLSEGRATVSWRWFDLAVFSAVFGRLSSAQPRVGPEDSHHTYFLRETIFFCCGKRKFDGIWCLQHPTIAHRFQRLALAGWYALLAEKALAGGLTCYNDSSPVVNVCLALSG